MGKNTGIEWAHHTFNPWWGCTKVSEACRNCYAESLAKRTGHGDTWGKEGRRRFFGDKHWNEPRRWNEAAAKAGRRERVFCASMADVFEGLGQDHPDFQQMHRARLRLWQLIAETPSLDWLLLTKRPESVRLFGPWCDPHRQGLTNAWVGTTVEDQLAADERLPHLVRVPGVKFVSAEPLLGPVDIERYLTNFAWRCTACGEPCPFGEEAWLGLHPAVSGSGPLCPNEDCDGELDSALGEHISWVIAGGESGPRARPSHPDWFRSLRDQSQRGDAAFLFKQWGEWAPAATYINRRLAAVSPTGLAAAEPDDVMLRIGKAVAGRRLDGRTHDGIPHAAAGLQRSATA